MSHLHPIDCSSDANDCSTGSSNMFMTDLSLNGFIGSKRIAAFIDGIPRFLLSKIARELWLSN